MRTRGKTILAVVVAVVVLGAVGVWFFVLRDTAPSQVSVGGGTTCASGSTIVGGTPSSNGNWTVKPGEQVFVGYRMKEVFGNDTLKKEAVGRTGAVTGTMTIADNTLTAVEVTADVAKLRSDQSRRDNFIKAEGLQTTQFPNATFTLTSPVTLAAAPSGCDTTTVVASGDLTVHGVTKPVQITVQARHNGDVVEVSGSTPIVLADYQINAPDLAGFVKVDDNGVMELQLAFVKA